MRPYSLGLKSWVRNESTPRAASQAEQPLHGGFGSCSPINKVVAWPACPQILQVANGIVSPLPKLHSPYSDKPETAQRQSAVSA